MSEFDASLVRALTLEPVGERRFRAQIPDGWQQGRGAFGGLVLGLLARAMEQSEPERERALRTLSGEIPAAVLPGPAELVVDELRRGSGVTAFASRLLQDGEVRAHATAILGRTRTTELEHLGLPSPAIPDPSRFEPFVVESPMGPPFARAFEYRCSGPLPFSGGTEPIAEGFVRALMPPERFGAPEMIALADAFWPATFAVQEGPRPMATISFSFQRCLDPAELDPSQPLYHRARTLSAHEGYATELRELWTADGTLVALNPQTFAVIR